MLYKTDIHNKQQGTEFVYEAWIALPAVLL